MKRIIDFLLACLLLVIVLIPMMVVGFLVFLNLGWPILFCQERPGLNGKPFKMLKFRTMLDKRDSEGELLPDTLRLTGFGKFMRSSSFDELPELWNVIVGDMSFVGPRPLLMEYLPLYTVKQARRHEVRPGITGWAQVNGRNALSWDEKFELDMWYVDNRSVWLDLKIMMLTVKKVLLREGINASDGVTMPLFKGSNKK